MEYDSHSTTDVRIALPISESTELLVNGDFENGGASWSIDLLSGWVISGGVATHTGPTTGQLRQTMPALQAGIPYRVVYELSNVSGTGGLSVFLGLTEGAKNSEDGTFSEILVPQSGDLQLRILPDEDFTCTLDNVEVVIAFDPNIIDTLGFESLTYAVHTGSEVDSFEVSAEEGDAFDLSDAQPVPADELLNGPLSFTSLDTDTLKDMGVVGKKRYQRLVFENVSGDNFISAVAILSDPQSAPVEDTG